MTSSKHRLQNADHPLSTVISRSNHARLSSVDPSFKNTPLSREVRSRCKNQRDVTVPGLEGLDGCYRKLSSSSLSSEQGMMDLR